MDSPHKGSVMQSFSLFFIVNLNKLFNKQSTCVWFMTPWCSWTITVMLCLLSARWEQHPCGIVEEDTHTPVRQLEAESVLVGVVYPLGHPQWLHVRYRGGIWVYKKYTIHIYHHCRNTDWYLIVLAILFLSNGKMFIDNIHVSASLFRIIMVKAPGITGRYWRRFQPMLALSVAFWLGNVRYHLLVGMTYPLASVLGTWWASDRVGTEIPREGALQAKMTI